MEKKILLDKGWKITGERVNGLDISVPGDVTATLYKNGLIIDPLFGMNSKSCTWIAESDWTYTVKFDMDENDLSFNRVNLCFDGVDTLSEITLNGVKVGETDNMFLAYEFDVKSLLKAKDNLLEVKILSVTKDNRQKNDGKNYRSLFTQDRIFSRKAQCHWGWDWSPNLPGIGLWLPVYIKVDDGIFIENVKIDTFTTGDVRFIVTLFNNGSHLFLNEDQEYSLSVSAGGKTVEHTVTSKTQLLNVKIDNPKLWWPNGYGEQNLYGFTVTLTKNGEVCSTSSGRFGIREITLCQNPLEVNRSEFALVVNGRKIFCKGSNWVPNSTFTGEIPDCKYKRLLSIAKDGNINILRIWGGGIYEKDIFYDLCDELGIMVMQDFMFACSAIPAEIGDEKLTESFIKEATYQIKRLRNHPSIAYWCGGNEYMPSVNGYYYKKGNFLIRVTLRGLCAELDPYRVYIHNSPCGMDDDEWHFTNGDSHGSCMDKLLEDDRAYSFRKIIASRPTQFITESSHMGPTRLRSIKKFIPEDEIWPTGPSWDFHFVENPYAIRRMTCLEKEKFFASKFMGEPTSVEDFLKKAMVAHAELIRGELDFARSNPNCKGFLNWMYNDIWGNGTWALVDYYYERKPVFYAMQRGFELLHLCFTEHSDGLKLCLVNDYAYQVNGKVKYSLKTLKGQTVWEKSAVLSANSDGVGKFDVCIDGKGDYLVAEFIGDNGERAKTVYFHELWHGKEFVSDISFSVEDKGEKVYEVKIKANAFARAVLVDYPCAEGLIYSDNFFDLDFGDQKTVVIKSEEPLDISKITVKTYADVWEE